MVCDSGKADVGIALLAAALGVHGPAPDSEIAGLSEWLAKLKLSPYEDAVISWCDSAGAVSINEILECWTDFADDLELKPLERKRLEKYVDAQALPTPSAPQDEKSPAAFESAAAPAEEQAASQALETFGPPEELERYSVLAAIGSGATAKVFRCQRAQDGHMFAAKTISLDKLRRQPNFPQIYEMLHNEIAILLSLHHPRVVSLFDVVEEFSKLHLVMELAEGGSLNDYILDMGSLPENEASGIFCQIAEGVQYIHSKGVVHQDLKPDNVLLEKQSSAVPQVKITDFGHSKFMGDSDVLVGMMQNNGALPFRVGTPLFSAPEVSDPERRNDSSLDLWSLGVMLYVMLLGFCPFSGSGHELEKQIQKGNFSFWRDDDRPPPSKEAQALVKALLRVDPRKRLSIDWCLVHPFVGTSGGMLRQLLRTASQGVPEPVEDRFQLPHWISDAQAKLLRGDLQKWMVKFRYSAMIKGREFVASYGDEESVDWVSVEAAHEELLHLMEYHIGAKRPSGGEATEGISKFRRRVPDRPRPRAQHRTLSCRFLQAPPSRRSPDTMVLRLPTLHQLRRATAAQKPLHWEAAVLQWPKVLRQLQPGRGDLKPASRKLNCRRMRPRPTPTQIHPRSTVHLPLLHDSAWRL